MNADKFWARVNKDTSLDARGLQCWVWTDCKDKDGYGRLRVDGELMLAHRFAWESEYGSIPEGMLVCHHCDNPPCTRPAHLFLGTQSDNIRDSVEKGRHSCATKTHCPQGHPYNEGNTRMFEGKRHCIPCGTRSAAEQYQRRKLESIDV